MNCGRPNEFQNTLELIKPKNSPKKQLIHQLVKAIARVICRPFQELLNTIGSKEGLSEANTKELNICNPPSWKPWKNSIAIGISAKEGRNTSTGVDILNLLIISI